MIIIPVLFTFLCLLTSSYYAIDAYQEKDYIFFTVFTIFTIFSSCMLYASIHSFIRLLSCLA